MTANGTVRLRGGNGRRRAAARTVAAALVLATAAATATAGPTSRPATVPADATDPTAGTDGADVDGGRDLSGMDLDQLLNVDVAAGAKQPQKAAETPAAVTVIGPDDIARSGLQSLPELLRLAPGMDVAQLNANSWAVSVRGFNDVFANKLQVLVDGRTAYTPGYNGVFWDMQNPLLQDLSQIEVIRGPGTTLYGTNAVDGVVNVTSKAARDTQGVLVTGLLGDYGQQAGVRYGGQADDRTYYRVFERYQKNDDFPTARDDDGRDGWQGNSAGFRVDRYATAADTFTVQGNAEENREGQQVLLTTATPPYAGPGPTAFNATGADLLGRWTHRTGGTDELIVQAYGDYLAHPLQLSRYRAETGDVYAHDRFAVGDRQQVVVGGEYRFQETTGRTAVGAFSQQVNDVSLATAFVQDDVTVVRDRVHAVVGTKVEEANLSGFDAQPSGRVVWTPDERNTAWASVSRAVRVPSVLEQQLRYDAPPQPQPGVPVPVEPDISGSPRFRSETLAAYEFGYKVKPTATLSFDASAAYNHYDHLESAGQGNPTFVATPFPHVVLPAEIRNTFSADSYAFELAANWQVTPAWRLAGSYSLLVLDVFETAPLQPIGSYYRTLEAGSSPRNQAQLHSYWDVTRTVQVNAGVYFTDALPGQGIPAYVRTDLNLVWKPRPGLDLTVGVQNLIDDRHPEFTRPVSAYTLGTQVPRTVYGQVTVRF